MRTSSTQNTIFHQKAMSLLGNLFLGKKTVKKEKKSTKDL